MIYNDDEKMQIALWLFSPDGCIDHAGMQPRLQDKLYEQYYKDMPYGTAKGRTGTPDE